MFKVNVIEISFEIVDKYIFYQGITILIQSKNKQNIECNDFPIY